MGSTRRQGIAPRHLRCSRKAATEELGWKACYQGWFAAQLRIVPRHLQCSQKTATEELEHVTILDEELLVIGGVLLHRPQRSASGSLPAIKEVYTRQVRETWFVNGIHVIASCCLKSTRRHISTSVPQASHWGRCREWPLITRADLWERSGTSPL